MKLAAGLLAVLLSAPGLAAEVELLPFAPKGQVPPGYPAGYEATVRAAEAEGRLVIYSTTDASAAKYLIDDFRSLYPRIEVEYEDINGTELNYRFVAETQLGSPSADVLWSSAMDRQAGLVGLGYALTYDSPESARLPDWAKWRGQAFGTTFEPVVIAYNKSLLAGNEVPRTRADLVRLLQAQPDRFKGKVVSYNVEKSAVGYFLASQDAEASPGFWEVAGALGKADARFELTTDAMLRRVASGQALLAYNVLGAYALAGSRQGATVGYVFAQDYTLIVSRLVFISRKASHPNAARLWVDYLLSRRGQTVIANGAHLYAVRGDIEGDATAAKLRTLLGGSTKPVAIGPDLTRHADNQAYRDFVLRWRQAVSAR